MSEYFSTALENNLVLNLDLEANGKKVAIHSGHIERFNLILQPYGFTCAVQFSAFGDDVDPIFNTPEVSKATLTFKSFDPLTFKENGPPLLILKGIPSDKCFKRIPSAISKKALRYYEMTFSDSAKAVWQHHFPIGIYVDQSMKDIIEKQSNPEISIKFDWQPIEAKHPITAFSLPHRDGLPEEQQTSFYSFLFWYLHRENGVLSYDYKSHSYILSGKKSKPSGKPLELFEWEVEPPICICPQPPRYNGKNLKTTFESIQSEDKENPNSFKAVRREFISPDNYRCFPEQAEEKVQSTLLPEKNLIEVELHKMKGNIPFDKLLPGSGICFKGNKGGTWSSDSCYKGKTFQSRTVSIQANKLSLPEELTKKTQKYRMHIKLLLEEDGEPFIIRPHFIPPAFPFVMQGKIFSDVGDKEQSTYKILESEKAPQGQYLVEVPLVEDGKKLIVPFTPDLMSGQFYFPFTKGQRVEISLYFHTAKILRLSDWQPLTRLPMGIQGCQTVLASNGEDNYTYIRHEYVDGKDSVFTIKQSSSATQSQSVEIKKDAITVMVDEQNKKCLSLSLDKEEGFTISLEDKNSSSTQEIAFDGKTMTHTCKGSGGTSQIVQKPDEIIFDCKKFSIKTEEVNIDAKNCISFVPKNKFSVTTKLADFAAKKVNLG